MAFVTDFRVRKLTSFSSLFLVFALSLRRFSFLDRNIKGLDSIDRESFHSIASVEHEIATTNLDDIEVDSRDSWESRDSRDSLDLFNERREVRWTRHFSKATIDDSHVLKPTGVPSETDPEDAEIENYCKLLQVHVRQSWPLFISGFHLKLKNVEHGKYLILAKLLGSKSKVLLDEDVTKWKDPHGHSVKFSDPLLLEVPSSSTILLLQVKHVSRTKGLLRSGLTKMKTLGYVYVKVKDILQEDNHRIHDFFSVQKGIPATLFCSVSLMSPYMNYITLLQLGSQNEKHEFGDDTNHFRKIQNEDAEEGQSLSLSLSQFLSRTFSLLAAWADLFFSLCVFSIFAACSVFTFGRMKYSKKEGVLQRSGISERNIRDTKACLESMKFEWYDQNKVIDVILIKMNNRNKEIKEMVALIFRYEADDGNLVPDVLQKVRHRQPQCRGKARHGVGKTLENRAHSTRKVEKYAEKVPPGVERRVQLHQRERHRDGFGDEDAGRLGEEGSRRGAAHRWVVDSEPEGQRPEGQREPRHGD